MRSYQILTLIGTILGILIAFSVFVLLSVFDAGLTSVEKHYGDTETYPQSERKSDLTYIGSSAGLSIFLMIIAIILVFVLPNQTKIVGVYLIIVSAVILIAIGLYGILPFALFLPAGIVALRYKQSRRDRFDKHDRNERIYPSSGGSPIK